MASYFSKSKGCSVWDLDNKKYIDMSIMGIGTNILGYGHEEVDKAVYSISKRNMSTLNCPEEVLLAEKLVELHPWFDMVRLLNSGGEANAIAIRIAELPQEKKKNAIVVIMVSTTRYLATNLNKDDDLEGGIYFGLDPKGYLLD